jgi:DNA-binding GntR family transcriptional regulator
MFERKTSEGYSRPPTSQEAVLGEIRRAIMTRKLKPGERVRQEELAERLNVSRVPVREALKVLEAEGQVTYQAHRGYTVVALSLEELEEIYLARRLLETEMTRSAVSRMSAELIEHLEMLAIRMDESAKAGDIAGYAEANWDFHFSLFERAGLSKIYRIVEVLWRMSEAYRVAIFDAAWLKRAGRDHRSILDACRTKDVAGAVAAQNEHRSNALESIIAILEKSEKDHERQKKEAAERGEHWKR